MSDEIRVVDPTTGGAKGSKPVQPHLAPTDALQELFEHYGKGEAKYPSDETGRPNYARGYRWSLSYNAAMRHLFLFWQGEDDDPETGSQHVIAAAWHCLALAHFRRQGKGTDDRWGGNVEVQPTAPVATLEPDKNASERGALHNSAQVPTPTPRLWVNKHSGPCAGTGACAPHPFKSGYCDLPGLRCVPVES